MTKGGKYQDAHCDCCSNPHSKACEGKLQSGLDSNLKVDPVEVDLTDFVFLFWILKRAAWILCNYYLPFSWGFRHFAKFATTFEVAVAGSLGEVWKHVQRLQGLDPRVQAHRVNRSVAMASVFHLQESCNPFWQNS